MTKFRNKYRIESARLQNWDYCWQAKYFVTVVTKDRDHFLGKIIDGKMILSEIGKIVEHELLTTPDIRPDMNLTLDIFTVMPNHFHVIIEIGKNKYNKYETTQSPQTTKTNPDSFEIKKPKNKFGSQTKNLGSIMRGLKGAIKSHARKTNLDFNWQPRFHDHIIRDDKDYERIKNYITNNPKNWVDDLFNNKP